MEIKKIYSWQCYEDLLSKIYYQYVTMERQMGHSASFSAVSNILQTMDGVRNTSAITVVTKSSMKPWYGAIANCLFCGYGAEKKRTQRRNKEYKGTVAKWYIYIVAVSAGKKYISGQSNIEQCRNQPCSLSYFSATLVWRHQIVSQSVYYSVKYEFFLNFIAA